MPLRLDSVERFEPLVLFFMSVSPIKPAFTSTLLPRRLCPVSLRIVPKLKLGHALSSKLRFVARRAKLSFLRGRLGKAARMSERFTTSDEFAVAVATPEEVQEAGVTEEQVAAVEAPVEEAPAEKTEA